MIMRPDRDRRLQVDDAKIGRGESGHKGRIQQVVSPETIRDEQIPSDEQVHLRGLPSRFFNG